MYGSFKLNGMQVKVKGLRKKWQLIYLPSFINVLVAIETSYCLSRNCRSVGDGNKQVAKQDVSTRWRFKFSMSDV